MKEKIAIGPFSYPNELLTNISEIKLVDIKRLVK